MFLLKYTRTVPCHTVKRNLALRRAFSISSRLIGRLRVYGKAARPTGVDGSPSGAATAGSSAGAVLPPLLAVPPSRLAVQPPPLELRPSRAVAPA